MRTTESRRDEAVQVPSRYPSAVKSRHYTASIDTRASRDNDDTPTMLDEAVQVPSRASSAVNNSQNGYRHNTTSYSNQVQKKFVEERHTVQGVNTGNQASYNNSSSGNTTKKSFNELNYEANEHGATSDAIRRVQRHKEYKAQQDYMKKLEEKKRMEEEEKRRAEEERKRELLMSRQSRGGGNFQREEHTTYTSVSSSKQIPAGPAQLSIRPIPGYSGHIPGRKFAEAGRPG